MSLLRVDRLHARYGRSEVLHGISMHVDPGEVVVMLGANGAGKTTTLRAISGLVAIEGEVTFGGRSLVALKPEQIVAAGIAHVPEGRGTFADFTVRENLMLGAYRRDDRHGVLHDVERWEAFFPVLRERRDQRAGNLSGGEQQMLALARALMSRPRLLLLDEPSQGLAPMIVRDLFERLWKLNEELGMAMLIVEQNAQLSLEEADRAYVLGVGAVALAGTAADIRSHDDVRRAYLGV